MSVAYAIVARIAGPAAIHGRADATIKNLQGLTPLMVAEKSADDSLGFGKAHKAVIQLLRAHEGKKESP